VSVGGQTSPEGDSVRRLRRQVEHAIEQLAALSGSSLSPGDFYYELLRKGLDGIDAPAGAIWLKSPQGFLQQQCQVNMAQIGLDDKPDGRLAHNQLLRYAFEKAKPGILGPRSRADGDKSAGNPTDFALALAPILNEESQTLGVIEIFQKPNWNPQDLITYTIQVAGYASNFLRNTSNRRVAGQEQIFTQLEVFSRQVHGSLNPTEVSYLVANEGRRLIGCDRISVGIRHGRKTTIEAVSGADVVEKASTHIKRMRNLFDAVITWGEKLIYRGNRDETLPPKVLAALDEYLMEQNPKLLVVLPIRDDREKPKEKEVAKAVRSCVMMEVFDPPEQTNVLEQKLEVVAAHSAPALYNASEMKRVPLKPLWWPLMRLQQGLGGKARFWTIFGITALVMLTLAMVFVQTPLKLDASGKLATLDRMYVYSPIDAQIMSFKVRPGDTVAPGNTVAIMRKGEWAIEINRLQTQIEGLDRQIKQITSLLSGGSDSDKNQRQTEKSRLEGERRQAAAQLLNYERVYRCNLDNPGEFNLLAPESKPSAGGKNWRILNRDFRDDLTGKTVQAADPVLRVGNTEGGWEVILKIPQKHVGKLFKAFRENPEHDSRGDFLWVDVLTISEPTPAWLARGKLYRQDVTASGEQNRDDQNESDQVFTGYVRINTPDIPKEYHVDETLLLTDVEVKAKIRCGDHALGYSLFYGVWEFIYEKVIFFF
jgi:hypothetical protein